MVQRFRSSDVGEIAETWRRFVPSSQLVQVDPARCHLDWFSVEAPGFSLVRYEMTADIESAISPEDQLFSCRVTPVEGGVEADRRALDPGLPWASDGMPVRARWRDSAVVHAIVFDRARAEAVARQLSGDDSLSIRVRSPEAVGPAAGAQWDRTFGYLASSLAAGAGAGADDGSLVAAGLERQALWTILTTFSTTFADAMRRSAQTSSAPKTVRRALSYIDAHAHEPITVDDVARAVHISTRGLQYAFQRSLDVTPSEYLRRARIAGARESLLAAGPDERLADIARRWGFASTARFSTAYLRAFGERPADTLARSR